MHEVSRPVRVCRGGQQAWTVAGDDFIWPGDSVSTPKSPRGLNANQYSKYRNGCLLGRITSGDVAPTQNLFCLAHFIGK